jgi:hypothetical protein
VKIFVLIFILSRESHITTLNQEFSSLKQCEYALSVIYKQADNEANIISFGCFAK